MYYEITYPSGLRYTLEYRIDEDGGMTEIITRRSPDLVPGLKVKCPTSGQEVEATKSLRYPSHPYLFFNISDLGRPLGIGRGKCPKSGRRIREW